MTPILIVNGPAGSGKDTIAQMIVDKVGGQCIAQADPMKRLCAQIFLFSEFQLWGPSEERNKEDPAFAPNSGSWHGSRDFVQNDPGVDVWLEDLGIPNARPMLEQWFVDLWKDFERTGRTLTPRAALQTLGTEFGRHASKNVWVDAATKTARLLLEGGYTYTRKGGLRPDKTANQPLVVITDGRFRNEILNINLLGGRCLKISPPERRTTDAAATEAAGIKGHASEAEQNSIPDFWYNLTYINNKANGLDKLRSDVENLIIPGLLK